MRNLTFGFALICMALTMFGCSQKTSGTSNTSGIIHDLNTPEGAILCLEDAYRAKDAEAAIKCKDFTIEASMMLEKLGGQFGDDKEILAQTAEVLELGFRNELMNTGFPDFRDVVSTFTDQKPYSGHEDFVQLTETCRHPDGTTSSEQLVVAKTAAGWKVISVVD